MDEGGAEQQEVAECRRERHGLARGLVEQLQLLRASEADRLLGHVGGDAGFLHELEHPRPADRVLRATVLSEAQRDELAEQEPVVRAVERREPVDALGAGPETDVDDGIAFRRQRGALARLGLGAVEADDTLARRHGDDAVGATGGGAVDHDRHVFGELHDEPRHGRSAMFAGGGRRGYTSAARRAAPTSPTARTAVRRARQPAPEAVHGAGIAADRSRARLRLAARPRTPRPRRAARRPRRSRRTRAGGR